MPTDAHRSPDASIPDRATLRRIEQLPRSQSAEAVCQLEKIFGERFWSEPDGTNDTLRDFACLIAAQRLNRIGQRDASSQCWAYQKDRTNDDPEVDALRTLITSERAFDEGDHDVAEQAAHRATQLAAEAHRADLEGFALLTLANLTTRTGDPEGAIEIYAKARDCFARTDLWEAQAGCLNNLAIALHSLGHYEEAIDALEASRSLAFEHHDNASIVRNLGNLAMIHREIGDHVAALHYGETCMKLLAETPNPLPEAYLLNGHGVSLFRLGRTEEAIYFYGRSLAIKESLGRIADTASTLANLVQAHLQRNELEQATDYLERVETILERMPHRQAEVTSMIARAELARRRGDSAAYLEAIKQSAALCETHSLQRPLCELLNTCLENLGEELLPPPQLEALVQFLAGATEGTNESPRLRLAARAIALAENSGFKDEWVRALRLGASLAAAEGNGLLAYEREKQAAAIAVSLESQNAERQLRALGLGHQLERAKAVATAERAKRDALAEVNRRLQTLIREREEMVGIVAHDLRNPLGGLRTFFGLLQVMLERGDHVRLGATLKEMEAATAGLLKITEELVEWGRWEEPEDIVASSWPDVVRESVDSHRASAQSKGIEVSLVASEAFPTLTAPPAWLRRITDNLLGNALKFSPPDSRVNLRLEATETCLRLRVEDSGPGLSAEDQTRLFRPAQRLSARPTAGESSSGMGLAAVKRIVDRIGGTIRCESPPGKGATFVVELPLTVAP